MGDHGLTADDLLWNWARWSWSGAAVGNMAQHIPDEEETRPVNQWHAQQVEALHAALPWHERMVVTAEYPQKNSKFAGLCARDRNDAARRWINQHTGVDLTAVQYKLYLGLFKLAVERAVR